MKLVCVATEPKGYFQALKSVGARNGFELVVLGYGQRWRGFSWRWSLLEEYLKTLDPEELVVHVDAYDVIAVPGRTVRDIQRRFRRASRGKSILLSVETPPPNVAMRYVYHRMFDQCQSTHVNGGCYAGKAGALLEMVEFLRGAFAFGDEDDDQQLFARMCATSFFADRCALDVDSLIFSNVWAPNTLSQGGIAWDASTARDTCFVHAPANADMAKVLEFYGIPGGCCDASRRGFVEYTVRGAVTYAKYLIPEYVAGSLCCVALLWLAWRVV
jgi:hypothetical protein